VLRVINQAARTDTGRQRHANEDSYLARSPVYVVADGMGGAQAGEVASQVAAETFDVDIEGPNLEQALAERAHAANTRIFELSREDESRSGMGTTLTGAVLAGDEVSIVHAGDSRAYLFRDGELRQLTRDHSLVEELRRQGRLTSEEAEEHPQRSIITRALGPERDVELDTHSHQARPGDVFLLCSDGLTSMVRDDDLRRILAERGSLEGAADRMIAEANEMGGRDNITVVLFEVGGEREKGADSDSQIAAPSKVEPELDETIVGLKVSDLEERADSDSRGGGPSRDQRAAPRRTRPADKRERRWPRRLIVTVVIVGLLAAAVFGALTVKRHTYFIGQDKRGLVALYQGFPYELPGGIKLYSEDYASSVPVRGLTQVERQRLLDHQLRSRDDAAGVVRTLERGESDQ
jgi:protein phosphatase